MTTQPEVKTNTPSGLLNEYTEKVNVIINHSTSVTKILKKRLKSKVADPKNDPFLTVFRVLKKLITGIAEFNIKLKEAGVSPANSFGSKVSIALDVTPTLLDSCLKYNQRYHKHWKQISHQRLSNPAIRDIITDFEKEVATSFNSILVEPLYFIFELDTFLENAIKVFPSSVVESASMQSCLSLVLSETTRMKIMYPELDEFPLINELESQLEIKFAVSNPRRWFATYDCTKFSRKTQDPRSIILLSDYLLVGERSGPNKYKNLKAFAYGDFMINDVPDQKVFKNSIDFLTIDKSFRANMKSAEDKQKLLEAAMHVQSFYYQSYLNIDLGKFAPVWIPDDLVSECQICNTKFTFINRRHHCRVCGACICTECTKKVALPQFEGKAEKVCIKCISKMKNNPQT